MLMMNPIRVVLIADERVLVEALSFRINAEQDLQVVGTAAGSDDGFQVALHANPNIAIFDVEIPGRGAFAVVSELRAKRPVMNVLFLTAHHSDILIEQTLELDIQGYLTKDEPLDGLLENIRRAAAGEFCFSKEVRKRLEFDSEGKHYTIHSPNGLSLLTSRQLEVLRHLAKGFSTKEVAKIMHRLGIHDRVALTRYAIREGLILP